MVETTKIEVRKINKTFNLKNYLVLIGALLLLVGCTSGPDTPKEAVDKSQEAMEETDSVIVDQSDLLGETKSNHEYQIDRKNDVISFENKEADVEAVVEGDEVTVKNIDGSVDKLKDSEELKIIREKTFFLLDPYEAFKQVDEEITDKFTLETEDEDIVLTYDSEVAESEEFATELFLNLTVGRDEKTEENIKEAEELALNDFKLELILDKSNYLLKDMAIAMQTKQGDAELPVTFNYEYSKYNEKMDITPPKETEEEKAEPETEVDADLNEEDAAAYLDALIQATIFQDVDGYIKTLPKSLENADSQKDAEFQRDAFKNYYLENTKQNMADLDIKDEKYEALADAFIGALKKTKYEIGSTKTVDNRVIVTLEVEGINDSKLYQETNEKLTEVAEKDNLEMDEIAEKNIDLLIEGYKDIDITEPVNIDVNVSKMGENYQVLLQDEFLLGGFVQ